MSGTTGEIARRAAAPGRAAAARAARRVRPVRRLARRRQDAAARRAAGGDEHRPRPGGGCQGRPGGAAAAGGQRRLAAGRRQPAHAMGHLQVRRHAGDRVARRYRRGRRLPAQDHRPAGHRRRAGVHHGQRRRGDRLRRRPMAAGSGASKPRPRTTAAPMSAAASGWTATCCTPAPDGPTCWRWRLRPARSSGASRSAPRCARHPPSPMGGVFFATLDNQLQALATDDGRRLWGYQAAAAETPVLGLPAPAYADGLVVAGFGSGELVALRAATGSVAWSDSLAAARGRNSLRRSVGHPRPAGGGGRPRLCRQPRRPASCRSTCAPGGACGSATSPPPTRPGSPATGCSCSAPTAAWPRSNAPTGGSPGSPSCRSSRTRKRRRTRSAGSGRCWPGIG